MNRYEKGKIYQIIAPDGTKYIGSTITTLSDRFSGHKCSYRRWKNGKGRFVTIFNIFEKHGLEDCRIELLENFSCSSKKELDRREGEIIKSTECINQIIPGRTGTEYRVDNKEILSEKFKEFYSNNREEQINRVKKYYKSNGDQVRERSRKYAKANINIIRERKRKYRKENLEKVKEQKRKWRELNREKINARKRELRALKKSQEI